MLVSGYWPWILIDTNVRPEMLPVLGFWCPVPPNVYNSTCGFWFACPILLGLAAGAVKGYPSLLRYTHSILQDEDEIVLRAVHEVVAQRGGESQWLCVPPMCWRICLDAKSWWWMNGEAQKDLPDCLSCEVFVAMVIMLMDGHLKLTLR